jgi:hypothetical protein
MNINNSKVIQFAARPPKPIRKQWRGPIEFERERCATVFLDPSSRGHWGSVARTLLCETAMSAEEIIDTLKNIRAETQAEIKADIAAGTFFGKAQ